MGAFRVARSAPDQDDQAGMVSGLTRKSQKVIAVAADEEQAWLKTSSSDAVTGNTVRKTVTLCFQCPNKLCDLRGDIVIEQELHRSSSLICSATKASIWVR
jgi:hypothetical protein